MTEDTVQNIVSEHGDSLAAMSSHAADIFIKLSQKAIQERGFFSVALSGGSTPKKLYELLTQEPYCSQIDWAKVHLFFGDERNVPPEHQDSNFRMANEALFSKIAQLPPENIHRVPAEQPAVDAANLYEQDLRDFFQNELPRFDLVLLGLGTDGHTASLFPDSPALEENVRWFVENWVEKFGAYRLTLTFSVINNARLVLFLVAGADKADIVRQIQRPDSAEIKYPAQLINPTDGKLLWIFDEAAGAKISVK
jgi:6-phosphogluconolactonase